MANVSRSLKSERNLHHGTHGRRWEDNIKIDLKEIMCEMWTRLN
jgi:hypothetical protein